MIITRYVEVKVTTSNMNYWKSMGYSFKSPSPRWGIVPVIEVRVDHLQENSNVTVECWCERCEKFYKNRFVRATKNQYCKSCLSTYALLGNSLGRINKGKPNIKISGSNHPRWVENKSDYILYKNQVYKYTRKQNIKLLKNSEKPRTLLGNVDGYQLDHILSIKDGFLNNIPPYMVGDIKNLQIIKSTENRIKWYNSAISLDEFINKFN